MYADGSVASDQAGWGFTVKEDTTNIHVSSAVYTVKTSSLTMEAKIVKDILHWILPKCASYTISDSVSSHSAKIGMGNSRSSSAIFKDLWDVNGRHGKLSRIDGADM